MSDSAAPLVPRPDAALSGPTAPDRAALRASDADREQIGDLLRTAVGEGRIDFAEFEERLTAAYAARTYGELEPLVADLIVVARPGLVPVPTDDEPLELRTRSGNVRQRGHWVVPSMIIAECTSGNVKIDFTEAVCPHAEVRVDATCGAGNITMVVPRGWTVRIDSASSRMGNVTNKANDPPAPGAPTLRVTGAVRSGNIKVRYPYRSKK
ncbi:MAG: DUF1707 domain-containing protein [Actinocatenispora sp.]